MCQEDKEELMTRNQLMLLMLNMKFLQEITFLLLTLKKSWVIDSGASAHMTPFRKDNKNIQPASGKIFLADVSAVLCKEMGTIDISISKGQINLGILKLDNILIVPSLDRRLFSVNSFLQNGNNWVHFEGSFIHLGIKDGPRIRIPILLLNCSNAAVFLKIQKKLLRSS